MNDKPTRIPERIELPGGCYWKAYAADTQNGGFYNSKGEHVLGTIGQKEAQAFAAALQSPAGEWRPISTAPKDGTTVFLFRKHSHQYIHNRSKDGLYYPCRWVNGRWSGWAHRAVDYPPTHWMPLPPAPTGEAE